MRYYEILRFFRFVLVLFGGFHLNTYTYIGVLLFQYNLQPDLFNRRAEFYETYINETYAPLYSCITFIFAQQSQITARAVLILIEDVVAADKSDSIV